RSSDLRAGQPLADLDQKIAALESVGRKTDAFGYHSSIEKEENALKWVQVDLGQATNLTRIVLHPCKDDFNNIGSGFGFPVRFKVEISEDLEFQQPAALVGDHRNEDFL